MDQRLVCGFVSRAAWRSVEDSFSRSYHRDQLSNWIIRAFENAGRQEQIIPLCEQEAVKTGSYTRLVDALRKAKRLGEAEQWIHRGIKATQKEHRPLPPLF